MSQATVIGGGTGAPVSIKALLELGVETSAVVAMADDGGSSGLLRGHTGSVPPGDVRKCIAAFAADQNSPWLKAFCDRFEYLNNHTLGNLMLTALQDVTGSFEQSIRLCEQLLDARGHVYPSTVQSVKLVGTTRDGLRLKGQHNICTSTTALANVSLTPARPRAFAPALDAIVQSDLVVLGPGSLFTSIIPNLLVPGVIDAIKEARQQRRAMTVFVASLADMQGETWGLNIYEHVEALLSHGMRGLLDVVIVHRERTQKRAGNVTAMFKAIDAQTAFDAQAASAAKPSIRRVQTDAALIEGIEQAGPIVLSRDLADSLRPTWHDPHLLAQTLAEVISACRLQQR
jgi:uncharacterized cofD-like protein